MKRNKEKFLEYLVKRKNIIIPIVGDKCFEVNEEDDKTVSIQEHIVRHLISTKFSFNESHPKVDEIVKNEFYGMEQLKDILGYDDEQFREEIIDVIQNAIDKIKLRDDVKEFIDSGKFEVVVTTTPYPILEKIFNYDDNHVITFVPSDEQHELSNNELPYPFLYKLFGRIDASCVLTEGDLLKYLHHINNPNYEKGLGAAHLVKHMKLKASSAGGGTPCLLMPIGCDNLPNWIFRFLWYPLGHNNGSAGGIWYKANDFLDFDKYLEEYKFVILDNATEKSNANESILKLLAEKFVEGPKSFVEKINVTWSYSGWDYFISYASEDRKWAVKVYDELIKSGKRVWFDNRNITVGQDYWNAIQYGIENSKRCIFIISKEYLYKAIHKKISVDGKEKESGVRPEISRINENFFKKNKYRINKYSIPLILDGTQIYFQGKNETLTGGILEKLPNEGQEFEFLETKDLFKGVQTEIINEQNLTEVIARLINSEEIGL